jgi:uncharacterized protein YggE
LSQGACSVVGYLATMRVNLVTTAVSKSGTAVGLAARLGASDPRLDGFDLAKPADARMRATAAAMVDAKARAQQLATAAGIRLGEIVSVTDQSREGDEDIVVTASMVAPPTVAAPPIQIDINPSPIETQQQVFVTYAIAPQ